MFEAWREEKGSYATGQVTGMEQLFRDDECFPIQRFEVVSSDRKQHGQLRGEEWEVGKCCADELSSRSVWAKQALRHDCVQMRD